MLMPHILYFLFFLEGAHMSCHVLTDKRISDKSLTDKVLINMAFKAAKKTVEVCN